MIAQLVMQFLRENEDLTTRGDLMTCLRFERKYRKESGDATGPLPGCYNYHEGRIFEATKLAEKVLEIVDNSISARRATHGR